MDDYFSMHRSNSPGVSGTFWAAAQEKGHPQGPLSQNASPSDRNSYRAATERWVPRAGPASGSYPLVIWNAAFTNEDKRQRPLARHRRVSGTSHDSRRFQPCHTRRVGDGEAEAQRHSAATRSVVAATAARSGPLASSRIFVPMASAFFLSRLEFLEGWSCTFLHLRCIF